MIKKEIEFYSMLDSLNKCIVQCHLCPRLVQFREQAPVKKIYENEVYWRKPVPGYGDPKAWLLISGLAPAAQGGNRTGRPFTGDKSGDFLVSALYKMGFANQPTSEYREDGLIFKECYVTAAVKCVPPKDKPLKQEILNCNPYFRNQLFLLKNLTHVLVLGKLAFDAFLLANKEKLSKKSLKKSPIFKHGQKYEFEGLPTLYASYHTSPRNTNTGKLSEKMFTELLQKIRNEHDHLEMHL